MALVKAVIIGAIGAIGLPYLARGGGSEFAQALQTGVVRVNLGDLHFAWSWPIFCVITLFAWAMFAWSNR